MESFETDRLAELISRKLACLVRLCNLGRQQADLIEEWRFRSGAPRTIEKGFSRTLRTARKWMGVAAETRAPEDFHRWRKHVKYHLYHLRLVAPVASEDLSARIRQAYRLQKLLADRKITLKLDDTAKTWLGNKGYDPAYGARPLKRVIQKYVQDPMAEMILQGKVHDGETVEVSVRDGELTSRQRNELLAEMTDDGISSELLEPVRAPVGLADRKSVV